MTKCAKLFLLWVTALASTATGFCPIPSTFPKIQTTQLDLAKKGKNENSNFLTKMFRPIVKDSWIENAFNHFEPIHGHGTGEKQLDDLFKAEQDLLKDRKSHYGNKKELRAKYKNFQKDHHNEIPVLSENPADLNKHEDDAMYVAKKTKGKAKLGWIESAFNNFQPIHGHGSGEKDLDAIFEDEKHLLNDRKYHFANPNNLRTKYQDFKKDHHNEIPTIAENPADLNKHEDDAMYVDDDYNINVPSFHIEEAVDGLVDGLSKWAKNQNKNKSSP